MPPISGRRSTTTSKRSRDTARIASAHTRPQATATPFTKSTWSNTDRSDSRRCALAGTTSAGPFINKVAGSSTNQRDQHTPGQHHGQHTPTQQQYAPANEQASPARHTSPTPYVPGSCVGEAQHIANQRVQRANEHAEMPNHTERMRILTNMGVRIGKDTLNTEQSERLSSLLYSYRDVMATDLTDIPEMKTEPHRIPLFDERPYVQQRYRYNPTKEQQLDDLCSKMETAGIIEESDVYGIPRYYCLLKPTAQCVLSLITVA